MHIQTEEVTTNDASAQELINETIHWSVCSLGNEHQSLIRHERGSRAIFKQMEIENRRALGQMRHCLQHLLHRMVRMVSFWDGPHESCAGQSASGHPERRMEPLDSLFLQS
jgi:hypothetical protein